MPEPLADGDSRARGCACLAVNVGAHGSTSSLGHGDQGRRSLLHLFEVLLMNFATMFSDGIFGAESDHRAQRVHEQAEEEPLTSENLDVWSVALLVCVHTGRARLTIDELDDLGGPGVCHVSAAPSSCVPSTCANVAVNQANREAGRIDSGATHERCRLS